MKRILTTLALVATVLTTMAQIDLHPREDGKIERLYRPDFDNCDTTTLAQLYREWDDFTRNHPSNETGWRNFHAVLQTYWMKRRWGDESRKARINYAKRLRESMPNTYTYYFMMIHYSSVDDPDDNGEKWARARYNYACKAMELLPDDVTRQDMDEINGIMIDNADTLRTNKLLFEYYDRNLFSPDQLQYHFNELQGMPDSAVYIGNYQTDFIPKLIIQRVLGMHRDKVFYSQGNCTDDANNAAFFRRIGVPQLGTYADWYRQHENPTYELQIDWHKKVVQHICDHSPRPVCFSANGLSSDWLTDSLKGRLYNEGLTLRYSATPYDNFAVKRRNIDQRYHLEHLLYPFQSEPKWNRSNWQWPNSTKWSLAKNYIELLEDQLPWYKKYDRKGYERLVRLFFRIMMNPIIISVTQMTKNTDSLPEGVTMGDIENFLKEVEDKHYIEKIWDELESQRKMALERMKNQDNDTKE